MKSGQLYAFTMGSSAWNIMETGAIVYVIATVETYPARVALQCLNETARMFTARVQESWRTCREGGLQDPSDKLLKAMCEKYDNLAEMDKLSSTLAKVDAVKLQMQDNIQQALENCLKLEKISKDAEDLQASAGLFRSQAKNLKDVMWWKNLKMKLMIACIVITILLVIILVICFQAGVFNKKSDSNSSSNNSGN